MNKERLELLSEQLSVPFTPATAYSELKGDNAELLNSRVYPWVTQMPGAPSPPYSLPVIILEGGEVWRPNGQKGTVMGRFVDFQCDSKQNMKQSERLTARETQPEEVAGAAQDPIMAEDSTLLPPLPPLSQLSPERAVRAAQTEAPRSSDSGVRKRMTHEGAAQTPWSKDVMTSEDEGARAEFQELPTP